MGNRTPRNNRRPKILRQRRLLLESLEDRRLLTNVSAPPILQWFESSYDTIEQRAPDLFMAGYGAVWTPPPSRGDTSDLTVGYDVYDRFDLGYPGKPTLYGTRSGLTTMIDTLHNAGLDSHVDFVMNHNGYSTLATEGFYAAGGYPGLAITLPTDIDGDFHSAFWGGDEYERLAGLIDIAHEKNYQFIRSPVDPNDSRNIRAGTTSAFGRLANVPDPDNRQFYPDEGHNTIYLYDPKTGETDIPVHQFNLDNPLAGDATVENATGYLMRNAQWLIQVIGVDGLRIDAAKHVQGFTLDFLDRAIYRQNPRQLLDGSTNHVFTYSEVYDADPAVLHPHVKKDINPADPGRIGGNRDTLDFKLYFALKENLEHGTQPGWDNWDSTRGAWYQIKDAALDTSPANGQGDTLHNGNAGVTFVQSHDVHKPYQLENVAYAYTLMMPGNTVIYFNGKEFGDNRDFPKDGRSDALSVADGSDLTRIMKARNTHGRGNYAERWIDSDGLFSFEREASAITLLSNRTDGGFDSRTLTNVGFAPGTYLVELTGNAADSQRDPFNDIPEVVQVFDDAGVNKVNVRFPRNANANGDWTGGGYLVYGLPTPQAPAGLELIGVDTILAGNSTVSNDFQNGSQRQTDLHVVTADQLDVRLQTVEVNLLGSMRDQWADGDNALLKLDGGRTINNLNPHNTPSGVDYDQPGEVTYGFERFEQKSSPLIGPGGLGDSNWQGDGEFLQTIDTTQLEEGPHFLEARAFRHRTDDGPTVFESFKKVIYVDRLPPDSTVASFEPWDEGVRENRDLVIRSLDKTADNVHVFLNLPAGTSDNQIMTLVNDGQGKAADYDRDLFKYGYFNVPHGNNVATIVSFEPTGNSQIQRVPGLFTSTIVGAGLGDLNHDGQYNETDVQTFKTVFESNQQQFNPAGDFNADGLTTYYDLVALIEKLRNVNASDNTLTAAEQLQDQVFGASDDAYTVDEESTLVVDPTGILANDRDPGSEGSLNLATTGEVDTTLGGKATFQANGELRYVPPASTQSLGLGESTQDSVQYVVNDGLGSTDTGTVTLTVTGVNDLPVLATLPALTLNEDGSFHGNGTRLGDYLSDIDSDEIQYRITNMASIDSKFGISIGMASNSDQFASRSDNSIHIHPASHFHGQTTVTIEARDLAGGVSNTQNFTVTIHAVNDSPSASGASYQPVENQLFEKDKDSGLITLVTDVEEDNLTFQVVTTVSNGQLTVNQDGSFSYTPNTDFNLTDSFIYRAHDGNLYSNHATITLEINTAFPWHNGKLPNDVNNDLHVTNIDALLIINVINSQGLHQLASSRAEGTVNPLVDVNRDGYLTAADALTVINFLNQQANGEGEDFGNDLRPIMGPLPDAQNLRRRPDKLDAARRALDSSEPSLNQGCVDDFYRSLSETNPYSPRLEPAQPVDEEDDWWDFLTADSKPIPSSE